MSLKIYGVRHATFIPREEALAELTGKPIEEIRKKSFVEWGPILKSFYKRKIPKSKYAVILRDVSELVKQLKKDGVARVGLEGTIQPKNLKKFTGKQAGQDFILRWVLALLKRAERNKIQVEYLEPGKADALLATLYRAMRTTTRRINRTTFRKLVEERTAPYVQHYEKMRPGFQQKFQDLIQLIEEEAYDASGKPRISIPNIGKSLSVLRTIRMRDRAGQLGLEHMITGAFHAYHLSKLLGDHSVAFILPKTGIAIHDSFNPRFKSSIIKEVDAYNSQEMQPLITKIKAALDAA